MMNPCDVPLVGSVDNSGGYCSMNSDRPTMSATVAKVCTVPEF